jgi:hypothetical protein
LSDRFWDSPGQFWDRHFFNTGFVQKGEMNMRVKRIAEADYIFWVSSAEAIGERLLMVTFRIVSGERDSLGRSLACCFYREGKRVHFLRMMLEACGKQVPRKVVRLNLDKMIGLECAGTVTDDGCGTVVISAFFPVADFKRRSNRALVEMKLAENVEIRQRYVM